MNFLGMMKVGAMMALLSTGVSPVCAQQLTLDAKNYTTPSWTKLTRLMTQMQSASQPYSINMTVNGDPKTQLGFAWFTNPDVKKGKLQIVEKADAAEADFAQSTLTVEAVSADVKDLNYVIAKNNVEGIEANSKRSYTSHKALAVNLKPGTTYSFRVGNEDAWSEIGHFTTAAESYDKNEGFSFIYITDTQAQNDGMFDVSQKTAHAAQKMVSDARFVLVNGDLVETSGTNNSEWEYVQWFSTMQDIWMNYPLVVAQGNHDTSSNANFSWHFNTDTSFNKLAAVPTTMEGTVYSFVQGDALFLVVNYEDYKKEGYFAALTKWMKEQDEAHKDVKWRIATFHKNMFTGSRSHQSDKDGHLVRENMLPVFDELNIDLALQGHDHIYEVIGPVNNSTKQLVAGATEEVETVEPGGVRENMTGKQGGVFNVNDGTLYFLNNSAGKKKYEPRDEQAMIDAYTSHQVENYWGLFSGKFGQTGEPTFSDIKVTTDTIFVSTYTVNDAGTPSLYDSFKVIKQEKLPEAVGQATQTDVKIYVEGNDIVINGVEPEKVSVYASDGMIVREQSGQTVSTRNLVPGLYIVKAVKGNKSYYGKVVLE